MASSPPPPPPPPQPDPLQLAVAARLQKEGHSDIKEVKDAFVAVKAGMQIAEEEAHDRGMGARKKAAVLGAVKQLVQGTVDDASWKSVLNYFLDNVAPALIDDIIQAMKGTWSFKHTRSKVCGC